MSLLAGAYAQATALLAPALRLHLRRRAGRGKEIAARLAEREGAGAARPAGRLLWLHAASVGETISILPLLEALAARAPDLELLVTTATVTGAETLARRLPVALGGRVQHRFAPLDVPGWVGSFLDGWRPDAVVLVESELWPNLIAACRDQCPLHPAFGSALAALGGWLRAGACRQFPLRHGADRRRRRAAPRLGLRRCPHARQSEGRGAAPGSRPGGPRGAACGHRRPAGLPRRLDPPR